MRAMAPQLTPRLAALGFRAERSGAERSGAEPGVSYLLPPLCAVPAGPFQMGAEAARDGASFANERPARLATLPAYQIARYPVTVAEYACFVAAGGAEPPPGEFAPIAWERQLARLEAPVVCVSWDDACAYAAWLAVVSGWGWRLPSEAEWERAARGTDGRIYPWGDTWDAARCATQEGRAGRATRVGDHWGDESPCGARDLAGNVWEWTTSLRRPYPYDAADGRERPDGVGERVVRGGCWRAMREHARTTRREGAEPAGRSGVVGFRLALSEARAAQPGG